MSETRYCLPNSLVLQSALPSYKVVVVGGCRVGKTSLIMRKVVNYFKDESYPRIDCLYRNQVMVDGKTSLLKILDLAGNDEQSFMREQYLIDGEGYLLVFDMTNMKSLEDIGKYLKEIKRIKGAEKVPMVLVGSKTDLPIVIDKDRVREIARKYGIPFVETSSKSRMGVDEAFDMVVQKIKIERVRRENVRRERIRRYRRELCWIL